MKKRSIMLGSAVLLAVLLVVGGTMAWFTAQADPVTNVFNAGTVKIILHDEDGEGNNFEELSNINPGDTHPKVVYVENDGSEDIYVRVKLTPKWSSDLANVVDGIGIATYLTSNNWELLDGWYYYKGIVEPGDDTDKLIQEVVFAGAAMGNAYQDETFELKVEAEAIQAKNGAIEDQWRVSPVDWSLIP